MIAVMGFFFNRLIRGVEEKIQSNHCQLSSRVEKLEREVEALKTEEHNFQSKALQNFVHSDTFYREVGGNKKVVDEIFNRINELSGLVNRMIGAIQEKDKRHAQ